jgi:DNA-binding NarL/FixJ family response regulator
MIKIGYSCALSTKVEGLLSSSIRILIADDYEGWRRQVRLLFQERPEWQVIAEALDGSEAVQKAEELKPDLILLDIGLPRLNGIEAARRIQQLSPGSKIIFLSLHNSLDVVQAALSTGARGYVRKTEAQSELLPAVDAVLRGKQYVSSSLEGYEFTDTSGEKAPYRHEVLFYSDDTVLLDGFARFIAAALKAGNAAIVLVTKLHGDSLLEKLKEQGVDTDDALQQGTYVPLDVAEALSEAMVDGLPDQVRFFGGIGGLIEAAAKAAKSKQPRVVVCGEGVALLHAEGKTDAAIQIERGCNNLAKIHHVEILCAYPLRNFNGKEDEHDFQSICAEHSAVYSR